MPNKQGKVVGGHLPAALLHDAFEAVRIHADNEEQRGIPGVVLAVTREQQAAKLVRKGRLLSGAHDRLYHFLAGCSGLNERIDLRFNRVSMTGLWIMAEFL
jgi:hypothetical protein